MKKKTFHIFVAVALSLCGIVSFVEAIVPHLALAAANQGDYVALTPLIVDPTNIGSQANFVGCTKAEFESRHCLPKYLRFIYNTGVLIAGFLAVFSIVRGGFTLLFTDSILGHSEAKGQILRALGGMILVYSSYILMNQINPQLASDLDLSLDFNRVTVITPQVGLYPTADSVEEQLRAQLDKVNPEIRKFREQADAKQKLADAATDPATKAALQKEANDLREQSRTMGNANAPSELIKKANMNALGVLWDPSFDAKYVILGVPLGSASKPARLAEATKLRDDMDLERDKITGTENIKVKVNGVETITTVQRIPDAAARTAALKELNDTQKQLTDQIRYYKNGCGRDGKKAIAGQSMGDGMYTATEYVDCPNP
ncbi:MAG: hypothetical protein Q7R93_03985 [bacterium]|nr:hypothetical protein [bacterium]